MTLYSLKPALLSVLLLWQAGSRPVASPEHMRYRRAVTLSPGSGASQACAALDEQVFAHASASLKDLRLYRGSTELAYAITLSEPMQQESEDARILNPVVRSGRIVFDLEMPHRPYTNLLLDLAAKDFIATATVSGSDSPGGANPTPLGTFTLFDLTSQHLARSTGIPLSESSFPYLHLELVLTPAPGGTSSASSLHAAGIVRGVAVPPSREAQTVYTTLQQTTALTQRGQESVALFHVPIRVPVERIAFTLDPGFKGNFSRAVKVDARGVSGVAQGAVSEPAPQDEAPPQDETSTAGILRVHALEAGHELSRESLTIPAAIGSNMQRPATIEVAIENGDAPPLPIAAVLLQMRQRRICFDATAATDTTAPVSLYYGDPALEAPAYDYARLFQPSAVPRVATLQAEMPNPRFTARREARPFTSRHPELIWIALLGLVCVLALATFRSIKALPR